MFINTTEKAVIENAGLAISDLEHFAETSDLHQLTVDTVSDAARNVIRIEDELRAEIKRAQHDLQAATDALDARYQINPRGVLQNTAREIDTLAARRADAYTHLTAVCRTVTALPTPGMITLEWATRFDTHKYGQSAVEITPAKDRDHADMIAECNNGEILTRTVITGPWTPEAG